MTTHASSQPLDALAKANQVRQQRARLKQDVKAGRVSIRVGLGRPCAQSMRVIDLLACRHMWGPARARNALRVAGCSQGLRVMDLTDRQREALAELAGGAA